MRRILLACAAAFLAGCVAPPARVDVSETRAPDQSYMVDLPTGWIKHTQPDKTLLVSRDGFPLQTIILAHAPLERAFPRTKKAASETMLPSELAELYISELKNRDQQLSVLKVIENEPVRLDGRDGFRSRVSYMTPRGLEMHHVSYGLADKSGFYRIEYAAPKLYYFDRTLGDFEKTVASFRLTNREKTATK